MDISEVRNSLEEFDAWLTELIREEAHIWKPVIISELFNGSLRVVTDDHLIKYVYHRWYGDINMYTLLKEGPEHTVRIDTDAFVTIHAGYMDVLIDPRSIVAIRHGVSGLDKVYVEKYGKEMDTYIAYLRIEQGGSVHEIQIPVGY